MEGAQKPGEPGPARVVERLRLDPLQGAPAELGLPALGSEAKRAIESTLAPNQIGVSRKTDVGAQSRIDQRSVRWESAAEGFATHIRIVSPGAAGLRAGMRFDAMPEELEIGVAEKSADGAPAVVARTTGRELRKLARGALPIEHWTASTRGEEQVIELWSPRRPGAADLRFTLFDVSHLVQPATDPVRAKALEFSCHVDISCISDPNVRTDGRAVARMVFVQGGGTYACTGSLLNDRASSFTPLFATANHCISTASAAATLETWWFYYPLSCGGAPQAPTRLSGGAMLLLADFNTDFALLRLAQNAPAGTFFLGWDPALLTSGQAIFGIHHPDGSFQRYSAGTFITRGRVTDSDTEVTFSVPFNEVSLTQGIVEGGSSGSPLLTAPSSFRGTLFGSPESNACGSTTNLASYSDFSSIYPLAGSFLAGPDPADDHGDSPAAATPVSPNAKFVAQMNHSADADWFRFVFDSAGTWTIASFDPAPGAGTDVGGEIYGSDGATLLDSNDDRSLTDLNFEMTGRVSGPGTLYLRVTGFEGAVGAYGIRSSFVLPDDYGDTSATATNLAINGAASGFLGTTTDQDWFRLSFTGPGTFHVNTTGTTDTIGALYQADGITLIAENDDANPPDTNFGLTANVDTAGTLFLKVTGWEGDTGNYGLVTSFTPASTAANYTDLWFNPAESGWGINLNHQSDTIFATLFTYAADGRDMWLVASGLARQPGGAYTGPLYRTVGPPFDATPWTAINVTQVGTMTLTFTGSNQATLAYTVNGVSVTKTLQRQVFSTPPTCSFTSGARTAATNYQDLWWNPAESGWGINLTHQGTTMFATLFTYAADNRDLWLVASGLARQADGSFFGPLYRTNGPPFNAAPWSPIGVTTVGSMRLAFTSGIAGTLTYTFNGISVTKAIQRQVFGAQPTLCQ